MTQRDQLREAVKDSGLTLKHICEKAGVTPQTYHNFMKTGRGLSVHHLENLAKAVNKQIIWVDEIN